MTRILESWHGRAALWVGAFFLALIGPLTGSLSLAMGLVLGPFAGGIARDWQSCCAENSLALAPYGLGGLGLAALGWLMRTTPSSVKRAAAHTAWVVGLVIWFSAGLLSYGHALE